LYIRIFCTKFGVAPRIVGQLFPDVSTPNVRHIFTTDGGGAANDI
jgi:hypothetical protein